MRLLWILTSILGGFWWWLLSTSLQYYRLRISTITIMIALSIFSVLSIISFPHIYYQIFNDSIQTSLSFHQAYSYVIYMLGAGLLLSVFIFYRGGYILFIHQFLVLCIVSVLGIFLPNLGLYPVYYFFVASGIEEYIKYHVGFGAFRQYGILGSDIVLFGLLSGLGFACIENITYLVQGVDQGFGIMQVLIRWIVGPIVHMIFSGILAYGYWRLYRKGWGSVGLVLSTSVAVLLHALYNTLSTQINIVGLIGILIVGYGFISRLLFQCDRLYFNHNKTVRNSTT